MGAASKADRGFFLGLGRSKTVFMKPGGHWEQTGDKLKFDLPANTLVYAEIVQVRVSTTGRKRIPLVSTFTIKCDNFPGGCSSVGRASFKGPSLVQLF